MLRQIASIFGTRVVVRVLNLGLAVLLARHLGPELQGVVGVLTMIAGLLSLVGGLGLDAAAIYFINRERVDPATLMRRTLPVLGLGVAVLALAFAAAAGWNVAGYFAPYQSGLLVLVGMLFPLDILVNQWRHLWLAQGRVADFNRSDLFQTLGLVVLTVGAMAVRPHDPGAVLAAFVANRVVTLLLILARDGKVSGAMDRRGVPPSIRRMMGYAFHPWLGNLFSMLNIRLDALMLAGFAATGRGVSAGDLGLYTICVLAVSRMQEVQNSIHSAYFPRVAELPVDEAAHLAARMYRMTGPVYLGIFAVSSLLAWPALWLFGPEYLPAWPVLILLTFGVVAARGNMGVLAIFLSATGRPHLPMLTNAVGVVGNVALNLVLIPRLGLMGAALATTLSAFVTKGLVVVWFLRGTRLRYRDHLAFRRDDVKEMAAWLGGHLGRLRDTFSSGKRGS